MQKYWKIWDSYFSTCNSDILARCSTRLVVNKVIVRWPLLWAFSCGPVKRSGEFKGFFSRTDYWWFWCWTYEKQKAARRHNTKQLGNFKDSFAYAARWDEEKYTLIAALGGYEYWSCGIQTKFSVVCYRSGVADDLSRSQRFWTLKVKSILLE